MICSIFAVDPQGGLGKNNTLPWPKDKEDLAWFKTNTSGHIVVMGRHTWEDPMMPKPLPHRINAVVASKNFDQQEKANTVINYSRLKESLQDLQYEFPIRNVWIIGGAQLLKSTVDIVEKVYLTRFDSSYDCDITIDINNYLHGFELIEEKPAENKRFQIYAKLPGSITRRSK